MRLSFAREASYIQLCEDVSDLNDNQQFTIRFIT